MMFTCLYIFLRSVWSHNGQKNYLTTSRDFVTRLLVDSVVGVYVCVWGGGGGLRGALFHWKHRGLVTRTAREGPWEDERCILEPHFVPHSLARPMGPLQLVSHVLQTRGGTPYNGLYGEAPPERGTFFRLQVYKRVGISQV